MPDAQQSFHVGDPGSNPGGDAADLTGESGKRRRSRKRQSPQYHPSAYAELVQRILARTEPGDSGCVLWTGGADKNGYGRIRFRGALYSPHRAVLEAKLGRKLARDEDTRHSCDRPRCVNEDHLSAGDRADNVRDAIARGRHFMPPNPFKKGEQGFVRNRPPC